MASHFEARRVVVIGGGISGLAAAYELAQARRSGVPVEEFLIEAGRRLGGVIRTERRDGFIIEGGPDSFLTEKPHAARLAREVGLGDALVSSNDGERRTYIVHHGRLVPLPDGLMLMAPTQLWPAVTSPLIPFGSKLAMARDWFRSPSAAPDKLEDESVATFVRRHFGRGILENIADPLLAGVYGGDSEQLSIRATLPRFWEMEQKHGSLIKAAMEARSRHLGSGAKKGAAAGARPLFTTLRSGLEQLVEGVAAKLETSRTLLGQKVAGIEALDRVQPRFRVHAESGESHEGDAVILALPAGEVARLLGRMEPEAEWLGKLPCSSVATVSLAYDDQVRRRLPPGFGFLVPRKEKRRLLACTFVHTKFPGRVPDGKALLRCFLGGTRDSEVARLSEPDLRAIVRSELKGILDLDAEPLFLRAFCSANAMPQYGIGHGERVRRIEDRLCPERRIFLAGNAYAGIGISDCIRSGREAARRALQAMGQSCGVVSMSQNPAC